MNRLNGILALTVAASAFAATGRLHAQDRPPGRERQPVRDRDLIVPPGPRPADNDLDTLLDKIARDALANAGNKSEPARPKVDEQLAALIAELTTRLRPVLESELRFARGVCRLSDGQVERITPDATLAFENAVQRLAEVKRSERAGLWLARTKEARYFDPRNAIQQSLVDAIRTRLSVDLAARYAAEVASRNEDRKRAGVLALVAKLDGLLVLSTGQRDQLSASLSSNLNEAWFEAAGTETDLPSLPDNLILPFLTQTQREVWLGTIKVEAWVGIGNVIRDAEIELNWQDEAAPQRPGMRRR
jgi:hypothetical protein